MGKIELATKTITDANVDSSIFLSYIEFHGFNPKKYNKILELFQSPLGSISQFLREYRQYLLSRSVVYSELDALGIDGAKGYIDKGGIVVPKSFENDERFIQYTKSLFTRHGYNIPSITEFDVMIANGTSQYMYETANFDMDKYIGFCMDEDDKNLGVAIKRCERLAEIMNGQGDNTYEVTHDTLSKKGKELCLIKKKGN